MKALLILLSLLVVSLEASAQNWVRTAGPVEDDVLDLCIDSNGILYAVTPLGVNRSTNGGDHWTRPFLFPQSPDDARIVVAHNGAIVVAGNSGIFLSEDQGKTFTKRLTTGSNPVIDFAISGNGRIFAATKKNLWISDHHGAYWKNATDSGRWKGISPLGIAASHDTIIAHAVTSDVFCSVDNGNTWRSHQGLDPSYFYDILIHPDGSWFCLSIDGALFSNRDHGDNWAFFWYSGKTYSLDMMHDGSMFVGSDDGLQVWRDSTMAYLSSGFEVDSLHRYIPVIRVVEDSKQKVYYAATNGTGVWRTSSVLQSRDDESTIHSLHISPNPFFDRTTINFAAVEASWAEIELRNILGVVVWKQGREFCPSGTNALPIAVPGLPPGNYLLVLRTNERTETQWVTIVK